MKKNLAVFFGGKSCEHDVSVVTGSQAMENADKQKYNVIPVYVDREGQWFTGDKLKDVSFIDNFDESKVTKVYLRPTPGNGELYPVNTGGMFKSKGAVAIIDVALLAFHGMNGEDGTIQGLFELADIPYTSSTVLGSSVGMDKIGMRLFFDGMGLPVLEHVFFDRNRWEHDRDAVIADTEKKLKYPMFIKPANLGSSIGISRADDRESLITALDIAFHYDRRVIVERAVAKLKEVNCSALGFGDDIKSSVCEQPVSWEKFLTFDEKYLRGENTKGMKSLNRIVPAPISDEMTQEVQDMTRRIFSAMDGKGVVRVDYIIDEANNKLYVNEVNTIPGSLAYYLWEPLGMNFQSLIDELVKYAIQARDEKQKNNYAFDSKLLKKFKPGGKLGTK